MAYTTALSGLCVESMGSGFFAGWAAAPTPEEHFELLRRSTHIALAVDGGVVVGFANALSDGVLSAYIPLLEVLPPKRGRGIGSELIRRLLDQIGPLYMVDVMCDADVQPFYERLGFVGSTGAVRRNYSWQADRA